MIDLSKRELNAVLAGLRLLQQVMTVSGDEAEVKMDLASRPMADVTDIFVDGKTDTPLTLAEIDSLCERINL